MKLITALKILIIPLIVGINLMVALFIYYMTFPLDIVQLNEFEVTQETVQRGDFVDFTLNFEKKMDYKPSVSWYLVDTVVIQLNNGGVRRPLGEQEYKRQILIPDIPAIAPDQNYKLRAELEYPILNGLRNVSYVWESNEFQIVE